MTVVDITDFPPSNFTELCQWLIDQCGPARRGDDTVLLDGESWRIYKQENTVEGYYETTIFLEFDYDSDSTVFLLRWT